MQRFRGSLRIFCALVTVLWVGLPGIAATLPSTGLMGTVKSSDGKAIEGVAVSARSTDKTFTTSVFTNRDGEYYFPSLANGQYRVWSQAVGFQTARSEKRIVSGKKIQQDFALKPLEDFSKQLSGTEWANSLPEGTPEDRRLKRVFEYNCSGCHVTGYVLAKKFDAAGWGLVINAMINQQTQPDSVQRRLLESYKDEMVAYLTRIRGPQSAPLQFKPLPRVTGEATEVVVTEYDIPRADQPNYLATLVGSDWMEGIHGRTEGSALHDAMLGKDGNVWFSDNSTPERSIGKLDPRTGRVTSYKLAGKGEVAVSTHGVIGDQRGNIWFTNLTENTIDRIDPKTGQFQRFPNPLAPVGRGLGLISIAMDSKGNLWTSEREGTFRLNPQTGEYAEYKTPTKGGQPYGMTVDSEDNAWFAQLQGDKVSVVDARTGQVTDIDVAVTGVEFNPKDREIGERSGSALKVPPVYAKGPRRMAADPKGDAVWVAEYWAGKLAKFDIHTKKVTEYNMNPDSHPYTIAVDKNHMVWIPLMNGDRIVKFNPSTEKFTEYPLPTLGSNARWVDVDNSTDVPSLWLPYTGANKIAHIQFRAASGGQVARNAGY